MATSRSRSSDPFRTLYTYRASFYLIQWAGRDEKGGPNCSAPQEPVLLEVNPQTEFNLARCVCVSADIAK